MRDFEDAMRQVSAGEVDFEYWARLWGSIVAKVERGYTLTIDDYTHDLFRRSLIERALALLSPLRRAAYLNRLEPLDERFRASTRDVGQRLLPGYPPEDWWQSRVPRLLVEELLGDLKSYGIDIEDAGDSTAAVT